jgi:hypothetical protein
VAADASPGSAGQDAANPQMANVLVVDPRGAGAGVYTTLRAACLEAKPNDVIALRFDGELEEPRPIRLENKPLTIRAQDGYRPLIVFRPVGNDQVAYPRSMLFLSGGRLNLVNVALELIVPRSFVAEPWTLLEVQQAEQVRLERCSLTIRNATDQGLTWLPGVSFIDVTGLPSSAMMMNDAPTPIPSADIELQHCVARGQATFVRAFAGQSFDLAWQNGVLAVTEQFYAARAGSMTPRAGARVAFDLRHLTVRADGGFCRMEGGATRNFVPAEIRCVDSILAAGGGRPTAVVEVIAEPGPESKDVLVWHGNRNAYDGFATFWRSLSAGAQQSPEDWTLVRWRDTWGDGEDVAGAWTTIDWRTPADAGRPVHVHVLADYALDDSGERNPLRASASDAKDVGAELKLLPDPIEAASPTRAATSGPGSTSAAP